MVRLTDLTREEREFLLDWQCPEIDIDAFQTGPPLSERRVAMVTSAGLRRHADSAFNMDTADYRVLPLRQRSKLVMDHVSAGYDRTGFTQDLNVVLPLDRLVELADDGRIGSVADFHYSFMGAADIRSMEEPARHLARDLKRDGVDTVLLSPV